MNHIPSRQLGIKLSPLALKERQLGPDVARGVALLGIVVANMYIYVGYLGGINFKKIGNTGLDLVIDSASLIFFDSRGFPLFSALFGFGIAMLYSSAMRRGLTKAQFLLSMLKRQGLLLLIGIAHGIFLFYGDIITAYAIIGMIAALILVAPKALQITMAVLSALLIPIFGALSYLSAFEQNQEYLSVIKYEPSLAENYLISIPLRAIFFTVTNFSLIFSGALILFPMLLGMWLKHQDFFTKAGNKRGKYALWGFACLTISVLGALPSVMLLVDGANISFAEHWWWIIGAGLLHQSTGYFGAFAYLLFIAAICALVTLNDGTLRSKLLYPFAALGSMSLSGYLFQSLAAIIVYPVFALGMITHFSSSQALIFSVLTWAFTLLAASLIFKFNKRGPLEALFRRVLYGKASKTYAEPGKP